jgi:hypothetical protein
MDNLRASFMTACQLRPFTVEAIVFLPDHLHYIWTLPSGDNDAKGGMRPAFPPYGPIRQIKVQGYLDGHSRRW